MGMPAAPAGTQQDPRAQTLYSIGVMVLMGVIFYFALIRPQQKKANDQANLLKAIRPGDKIVTSSGIVAVVVTVKEKTLSIRSADAKLEITKSAVAEIVERGDEAKES